jgi:hypothetical protein
MAFDFSTISSKSIIFYKVLYAHKSLLALSLVTVLLASDVSNRVAATLAVADNGSFGEKVECFFMPIKCIAEESSSRDTFNTFITQMPQELGSLQNATLPQISTALGYTSIPALPVSTTVTPTYAQSISPAETMRYVAVPGPQGEKGEKGDKGDAGSSYTGTTPPPPAYTSYGGYSPVVVTNPQAYVPSPAIAVSTVGYLNGSTIDASTINNGVANNLRLNSPIINGLSADGASFTGTTTFSGPVVFSGVSNSSQIISAATGTIGVLTVENSLFLGTTTPLTVYGLTTLATTTASQFTASDILFTNATGTNLVATQATLGSLAVTNGLTVGGAFTVTGTSVLATTTLSQATIGTLLATNQTVDTILATNATTTNLVTTSFITTDGVLTNATSTNLSATNAFFGTTQTSGNSFIAGTFNVTGTTCHICN